jgi:hypothetical protein
MDVAPGNLLQPPQLRLDGLQLVGDRKTTIVCTRLWNSRYAALRQIGHFRR